MAYQQRSDPRRFNVGEIVEISSQLHTRFLGLHGKIIGVEQSRYAVTLDKYHIRLSNPAFPEAQTFWDIELKKVNLAENRTDSI